MTGITRLRRVVMAVGIVAALGASGCHWDGLNTLPLPGAGGGGPGSWTVRIQMPNVTTLTRNSPVQVADVTVGTVTDIRVEDWHALVTVRLDRDVRLPANAVARIGQTSLLGSDHVELAAPKDVAPQGELHDGDLIGLDRAGVYPTTEQTLSSLSMVLNGGGVSQLQTVTAELDTAVHGRADTIRDLLDRTRNVTATLNSQTGDVVAALSGLDRLAGQLARQRDEVNIALTEIHPALTVLADRRTQITATITALGDLSAAVHRVVSAGGDDLAADLAHLEPALQALAATGTKLTDSLQVLFTFPFPMRNLNRALKGDYLNLLMTVDLTASRLDSNFLTGTAIGGRFGGVQAMMSALDTRPPADAPDDKPPPPVIPGLPSLPFPLGPGR